ncbi:MAG: hypothetical protein MJK10_14060 [Pseudomonadales bacterium]|nr:hypothetical protein [Pseudomonadales bacterium]NRA17275.1 hypothetical protein [Oceanospirillaceae bacterium]
MNILLLPGTNRNGLQWFAQLQQQFRNMRISNHSCLTDNYSFWQNDNAEPSLEHEISLLPTLEFDLVIAKSLGTLVFLQAAAHSLRHWKKALLFAIPLRLAEQTKFSPTSLKLLQKPNLHTVQQRNDKLCPCIELNIHQPKHLLQIAGSDHKYDGFSLYAKTCKQWIGKL